MYLMTLLSSFVLAKCLSIILYGFWLSILSRRPRLGKAPLIFPRHVFAIIVPVANDDDSLSRTLEHLRRIKYPRKMFDIIIAPLNCSDKTLSIAREKNAIIYRQGRQTWHNSDDAIQNILERLLLKDRYDGYIILDAQSRIMPNFLQVMSDQLSKGALAIQPGYSISGKKWAWNTVKRAILYALKPNWLTCWPLKYQLGSGIHRTGLCISRRLVETSGVSRLYRQDTIQAFLTQLLRNNVMVQYTENTWVYDRTTSFPDTTSMFSQVWAGLGQTWNNGFPLIVEGLKWRSPAQVIGGINLFLPTFGTILFTALCFCMLGWYLHGPESTITLGWLSLLGTLLVFVLIRLWLMKAPVLAYAALPLLPFLLFWQSAKSCFHRRQETRGPTTEKPPVSVSKRTHNQSGRKKYSRPPRRQSG